MLLSEILNILYIYKTIEKFSGLTQLQKLEFIHVIDQLTSFSLKNNFEQRITKQSNSVLTDDEEQWLENFLKSRWTTIQGTNNCYTQNTESSANKICIALAKELANTLHKQYIELLMPSVTGIANSLVNKKYTNKSNLCEFVMTDDNTMLIHIDTALQQLAQTDKSTEIEFSELEQDAVIYHNKNTRNYYDMLDEKRDIKTQAGSLGYQLNQLKIALDNLCINNNGEEYLAAQDKFATLLSQLPSNHKETLFNLYCYDENNNIVNFEFIWNELSNEHAWKVNPALSSYLIQVLLDQYFDLYLTNIDRNFKVTVNEKTKKRHEQIDRNYRFEMNSEYEVKHPIYSTSAENKFIVSILSEESGIRLFCSKKTHFKFILGLDLKNKEFCIGALIASDIGNNYLMNAVGSLEENDKNEINQIINDLKQQPIKQNPIKSEPINVEKNPDNNLQNYIVISDDEDEGLAVKIEESDFIFSKKSKSQPVVNKKHSRENDDILQIDLPVKKRKVNKDQNPILGYGMNNLTSELDNQEQHLSSLMEIIQNENELIISPNESNEGDIEQQFELDILDFYSEEETTEVLSFDDDNLDNGIIVENQMEKVGFNEEPYSQIIGGINFSPFNHFFEEKQNPEANEKKTNKKSKESKSGINKDLPDMDVEFSKKEIDKKYNKALKMLKKIKDTHKKDEIEADVLYKKTNTFTLESEEKAVKAIKKEIMPLYNDVINYYSQKNTFETDLQFVKVALDFIHEYPISRNIYRTEILKLEECLDKCNIIINSSIPGSQDFKQEARDFRDIINTKHIPVLFYNYAAFNHRKMKIESERLENEADVEVIIHFIKDLKRNIKKLKNSISSYKELKSDFTVLPIISEIERFVAQSYEDIADYQYKLFDLASNENNNDEKCISLLKDIKHYYEKSFKYNNNDIVWLSIRTSQYKLIELYLNSNIPEHKEVALLELKNLINSISKKELTLDSPTNDELQNILETVSTMLYACNKAFILTKSDEYRNTALQFLNNNKELIVGNKDNVAVKKGYSELINDLVELNFIENKSNWSISNALSVLYKDAHLEEKPILEIGLTRDKSAIKTKTSSSVKTSPIRVQEKTLGANPVKNNNRLTFNDSRKTIIEKPILPLNKQTTMDLLSTKQFENPLLSFKPASPFLPLSQGTNQRSSSVQNQPIRIQEKSAETNSAYQYETEDIQVILKNRVKNYLQVSVLAAAQMNKQISGNRVTDVLKVFIREQGDLLAHENQEHMLLLPIQDGGHWVGLMVGMQGNTITSLTYFNSLKHVTVDNNRMITIQAQLRERGLINENIKIQPAGRVMQQCDGTSCGVLLIENFYCTLKNMWWTKNDFDLTDKITDDFRKVHLNLLKENEPEYYKSFQLRQTNNVISVPSLLIQQKSHGIQDNRVGFFNNNNNNNNTMQQSETNKNTNSNAGK